MKRALFLFTAASLLFGCSSDLDINAPYKNITVVYGLLNMRDSIHFVKINKAFLGEGDALVYAQVPDSSEFHGEDITRAMVIRIQNGNRVDSFPLHDTLLTDREPGTFYSPDQRLYYFRENQTYLLPQSNVLVYLDQNSTYELDLEIKGERITGSTSIVNDFSIQTVDQSLTVPANFMNGTNGYGAYELNWTSNLDGKRTEAFYRFNYDEIRGSDTLRKTVTTRIGSRVSSNTASTEGMSLLIDGQAFYSGLANAIPDDPSVDQRRFTGLEFLFTVANDDFHTFLSLSEPISGIIEDRPAWSNMDGAYGIFASRYNKDVGGRLLGKTLNDASLNELINGQFTGNRRFCSAFNVGAPYGCN
ncbi:MAG: hypothetical protein R2815_09140 [Flavobacteriales bacterium]|nr:DUF4249 family protein [Flavobacteriales bacterium]